MRGLRAFVPVWSKPAALRGLRAAVVIPGLFAISSKVIGNAQVATFAAFARNPVQTAIESFLDFLPFRGRMSGSNYRVF